MKILLLLYFCFLNVSAGVFHTSGTDYTLLSGQAVGAAQETVTTDNAVAGNVTQAPDAGIGSPAQQLCLSPQSAPRSIVSVYPKEILVSGGELYARLIGERRIVWSEPTFKDLGIH